MRDDDVVAWRRFAGDLRQRLGLARTAAAEAEARAADAEMRAAEAEALLAAAEARISRGVRAGRHTRACLNRVERLLQQGDSPAAVAAIARHRSWADETWQRWREEARE
jgi:hypothetical protein